MDRYYSGTAAGEVGPVESRLAEYGGAVGLVFGAFGEASESVEVLLRQIGERLGHCHLVEMGGGAGGRQRGRRRAMAGPARVGDDALAGVRAAAAGQCDPRGGGGARRVAPVVRGALRARPGAVGGGAPRARAGGRTAPPRAQGSVRGVVRARA